MRIVGVAVPGTPGRLGTSLLGEWLSSCGIDGVAAVWTGKAVWCSSLRLGPGHCPPASCPALSCTLFGLGSEGKGWRAGSSSWAEGWSAAALSAPPRCPFLESCPHPPGLVLTAHQRGPPATPSQETVFELSA